jgi:energy-coupling factor transporter ATP-binding protein EcfA2
LTKIKITIFKQYLVMALFVILARVAFRLIFGGLSFPGFLIAVSEGGKLASWVLGFGLLNVLVDFRRFLKRSPRFLRPITTALNLAFSVTPELAISYQRIKVAASLRARRRGIHLVKSVIVPVVSNAIDQAITLADSMEARGFGQEIHPAIGPINLENLNFSYRDGKPILQNVSLSIPTGQFTLICGNTGSGKSTLLRIIQAKIPGVGFVSQFPRQSFVGETVFDELAFSLIQLGASQSEIETRVAALANQFGLDPKSNLLELSAGWQQRVAVAAALSSGAKILLLDEPFSALDDQGTKQLLETFEKLKKDGVTLIVAEHRVRHLTKLADVALQIADGRLSNCLPSNIEIISRKSDLITALVGENGSGKTTYLRKLASTEGVLVPQPASDLLFLDSLSAELQQSDFDANKVSGTTANILKTFKQEIDESQNPRDLSEGQKLILAICIQLAKTSTLLLLDEPTLGLDTPSRQTLADILLRVADGGVEIILATHDREFANAVSDKSLEVSSVR